MVLAQKGRDSISRIHQRLALEVSVKSNFDSRHLQQLWLRQLELEFEDIYVSCGVELPVPIFEITDSRKELGGWCPATRTLRLSSHLIRNYSWSVTQQVVKHEMAHQLCTEWGWSSETPHNERFQQACELLGVLPEYRRAGVCLSELVEKVHDGAKTIGKGRRHMGKIEKLLALAESSNEHEAALAMQKATVLIEKYHLEHLGAGQPHRFSYVIIDRKRKRIAAYQRSICSILQDFFFVRVVLSYLYDPLENETYKTIELLGTRENVAIGEYCYYFLENRLPLLWASNRGRFTGSTRVEKNSYYLGLLRGFYQKMESQKRGRTECRVDPEVSGLVVTEEKKLDRYLGIRFPRLKKVSSRGPKIYGDTYRQGVKTGKKISFAEGLATRDRTVAGLLS